MFLIIALSQTLLMLRRNRKQSRGLILTFDSECFRHFRRCAACEGSRPPEAPDPDFHLVGRRADNHRLTGPTSHPHSKLSKSALVGGGEGGKTILPRPVTTQEGHRILIAPCSAGTFPADLPNSEIPL